jgi:hypothetical protein
VIMRCKSDLVVQCYGGGVRFHCQKCDVRCGPFGDYVEAVSDLGVKLREIRV